MIPECYVGALGQLAASEASPSNPTELCDEIKASVYHTAVVIDEKRKEPNFLRDRCAQTYRAVRLDNEHYMGANDYEHMAVNTAKRLFHQGKVAETVEHLERVLAAELLGNESQREMRRLLAAVRKGEVPDSFIVADPKSVCPGPPLAEEAVCGDDCTTYRSECLALTSGVRPAYRGPCRSDCSTAPK